MLANFKQSLIDRYNKKKLQQNLISILTNLKRQILQKTSQKQLSNNSNQILDNYNNIDKKSIFKKFRIEIDFELREDLIYYFEDRNRLQLYISRTIEKKIFKTIYNNNYYFDYYRCFARIFETLFISRTLNKIRVYIKYCFACQINQTKQHCLYNKLISILIESINFYTIVINYLIELSNKYNYSLTIIDKFNRRFQLISNYIIDFAIV